MKTELSAERTMTTKEVADVLGITPRTVQRGAKACFPEKGVAKGKAAFYTNEELTVMLDRSKKRHGGEKCKSPAVPKRGL